MVVREDECRYGASGLSGQGLLRTGLRDLLGAGHRVALGYVEKGFPNRAYGSALGGSGKARRNLTGDITAGLTPDLTERLPRGLTE